MMEIHMTLKMMTRITTKIRMMKLEQVILIVVMSLIDRAAFHT